MINFYNIIIFKNRSVYGGITEQDIEIRKNQHINNQPRQPYQCNNNWKIIEISHIKIKNNYSINDYINMISQLEQYLIDSLDNIYHLNCVNHRNNGIIAQLGGNGMNNQNLQIGNKVKLYVFYS